MTIIVNFLEGNLFFQEESRTARVGLTSSSHVLAGPDWLEADERDLHRQYEPHYVESAVSCEKKERNQIRDQAIKHNYSTKQKKGFLLMVLSIVREINLSKGI